MLSQAPSASILRPASLEILPENANTARARAAGGVRLNIERGDLIDFDSQVESVSLLGRPGNDLLSRVLRRSTIGAGAFHGRVRDGIGCSRSAIITRSAEK